MTTEKQYLNTQTESENTNTTYQIEVPKDRSLTAPERNLLCSGREKRTYIPKKFYNEAEYMQALMAAKGEAKEFKKKTGFSGVIMDVKWNMSNSRWTIVTQSMLNTELKVFPWEFVLYELDINHIMSNILDSTELKELWKQYPFNIEVRRAGQIYPISKIGNRDQLEDLEKELEKLRSQRAKELEITYH